MTVGFCWLSRYPYETVWANDFNPYTVETYNANFGPHCVFGDIVEILANSCDEIPPSDVVIGGPPCKGFSLLNKKRANDPRKKLWIPFIDVIVASNAQVFLMENVPKVEIAKQIGNTVPPMLAARLADRLYEMVAMEVNLSCDGYIPRMEKTRDYVSRPQ